MNSAITLALLAALSQDAAPRPGNNVQPISSIPADAVSWALADVVGLPAPEREHMRYVWIPPWGDQTWVAAVNYVVNTAASQAATIQNGSVIANGWMMRFDLRRLAPKPEQHLRLRETWDGLAVQDPYFHVPESNTKSKIAVIAPHVPQDQAIAVSGLTLSTGAVYRADFLIHRMLSNIDGGRYYEFSQIPTPGKDEKITPQAAWLKKYGVFEAQSRDLNADQRAAIPWSEVTGKPRRIDVFYGLGRKGNLVSITHDPSDDELGSEFNPIRGLLFIKDVAREAIVEKPNGLHAFALFDAAGNFVRSVPDNVAKDHTVPAPHTARLQPGISCIRCHASHDGWKPVDNVVPKLLSGDFDVVDDIDVNGQKLTREEIIDRLAGLYAEDLDSADGPLGRGRRDYSTAISRCAAGLLSPPENKTMVGTMSDLVSQIYADYRYARMDRDTAARELGTVNFDDVTSGGSSSDPVRKLLEVGAKITRTDWETIYADMAIEFEQKRKKK